MRASDITKPKRFIDCIDDDGNRRNLSVPKWYELTGKSTSIMHLHFRQNRDGTRKLTNRQIVGLDKVPALNMKAQVPDNINKRNELIRDFSKTKLSVDSSSITAL